MKQVRFSLRLDKGLDKKLMFEAHKQRRSKNNMLNEIVKSYFEKQVKQKK